MSSNPRSITSENHVPSDKNLTILDCHCYTPTSTEASQPRQLLQVRMYSSLRSLFYFIGHLEEKPLPSFEVHVLESVPFISNCKMAKLPPLFLPLPCNPLLNMVKSSQHMLPLWFLKALVSRLSEANILASAPLLHKVNNLGT